MIFDRARQDSSAVSRLWTERERHVARPSAERAWPELMNSIP
jgi:hypothetical protein